MKELKEPKKKKKKREEKKKKINNKYCDTVISAIRLTKKKKTKQKKYIFNGCVFTLHNMYTYIFPILIQFSINNV